MTLQCNNCNSKINYTQFIIPRFSGWVLQCKNCGYEVYINAACDSSFKLKASLSTAIVLFVLIGIFASFGKFGLPFIILSIISATIMHIAIYAKLSVRYLNKFGHSRKHK